MKDALGRSITYLRISLTDRCNLRCVYCMPETGVSALAHDDILRLEEIREVVEVAAQMGVRHIRFTGGEPLIRKGLVELVRQCKAIEGIEEISLTTNAVLLAGMARDLKAAGLDRVNISLDSLDPDAFHALTRHGKLEDALAGIQAALEAGLAPVKLNVVVAKEFQQDLYAFAKMTVDQPLHVRFIEWMPMGSTAIESCRSGAVQWEPAQIISAEEILDEITRHASEDGLGELQPLGRHEGPRGSGPARYYAFPKARGTVGTISAISGCFCPDCNRLRLTADGKLRPCLFNDAEFDVRSALREGGPEQIRSVFEAALAGKPEGREERVGTIREMNQVGG